MTNLAHRFAIAYAIGVTLLFAGPARSAQPPAFAPMQAGPMGWAGEQEAAAARASLTIAGEAPPELRIVGSQSTDNRLVCLWHAAKRVEIRDARGKVIKARGQHLVNIQQEIGDCVSWAMRNAINYSLAAGMAWGSAKGPHQQAHAPYIYGISRVQIGGGRLRGDGSTGAWAAAAVRRYGVLSELAPGVPPYSGSLARKWGARPGPPEEFQAIAKAYAADTRLVTTTEQARQSISNGWAIIVCSGVGFQKIVEANGRIEGRAVGDWAHAMCLIAYDSRPGMHAFYCLNSWGPGAHARVGRYAELDGAPPGGFWILEADAARMLRANDSYAVSFNGFQTLKEEGGVEIGKPAPAPRPSPRTRNAKRESDRPTTVRGLAGGDANERRHQSPPVGTVGATRAPGVGRDRGLGQKARNRRHLQSA